MLNIMTTMQSVSPVVPRRSKKSSSLARIGTKAYRSPRDIDDSTQLDAKHCNRQGSSSCCKDISEKGTKIPGIADAAMLARQVSVRHSVVLLQAT